MIPTPDKLKDIAALRKGNLAEVPYAFLVLALAVHRKSVVLEIKRTPLVKKVIFDDGSPVDCQSNVATETLGRFMLSIGKLTEAECQKTLSAATARGIPLEEVLVKRKLVTPTELYRILQQNLARKLLDGFSWRSGTFRISYDVPPVESSLRVKAPQLLVTGITRFAMQPEIDEAVSSLAGKLLVLNPEPLFKLEDLRLSAEQEKLAGLLQRATSAGELTKSTALPAEDLNRLIYPLLLLRIVVTADQIPKTKAAPAKVQAAEPDLTRIPTLELELPVEQPQPRPVVAESAPAAQPEASQAREDLMRSYLTFRRKDAFSLLELPDDAAPGAIASAYIRFADRFAPSKFDDSGPDALRDVASELFLAGARAYAELADNPRREALVAKRRRTKEMPKPAMAPPAPASKSASLLDPDSQYRLGRQLADAGRHREALSYFQFASECDAQNGIYRAELAYCRFMLMISTAVQTLSALKDVMRIDPKCGLAWYYTGKVHAALGNSIEAEAYLDRGKSMMTAARKTRR